MLPLVSFRAPGPRSYRALAQSIVGGILSAISFTLIGIRMLRIGERATLQGKSLPVNRCQSPYPPLAISKPKTRLVRSFSEVSGACSLQRSRRLWLMAGSEGRAEYDSSNAGGRQLKADLRKHVTQVKSVRLAPQQLFRCHVDVRNDSNSPPTSQLSRPNGSPKSDRREHGDIVSRPQDHEPDASRFRQGECYAP